MAHAFGHCMFGQHALCPRQHEKFYFGPKSKANPTGLVMTGEIVKCHCTKRGCKCYVDPKSIPPEERKRKKKK